MLSNFRVICDFFPHPATCPEKSVVKICDSVNLFSAMPLIVASQYLILLFACRVVQRCSGTILLCENIYIHMVLGSMFVQNVERYM